VPAYLFVAAIAALPDGLPMLRCKSWHGTPRAARLDAGQFNGCRLPRCGAFRHVEQPALGLGTATIGVLFMGLLAWITIARASPASGVIEYVVMSPQAVRGWCSPSACYGPG